RTRRGKTRRCEFCRSPSPIRRFGGIKRLMRNREVLDARRWNRWPLRVAAAWIVLLVYGWWFTDREPFSPGAFRALLVVVAVLIVAAEVHRARRASDARDAATRGAPGFRVAVVVWSVLVTALVVWEL